VNRGLVESARRIAGPRLTTRLRCIARGYPIPRWGNMRRVAPFSEHFGFERGQPVDRHYVSAFFEAHRADIRRAVLEIQSPSYATRFGQSLTEVHSVDINPDFRATYTCDLAKSDDVIPSERYDCFLIPNTLSHVNDLEPALRNAYRIVRAGGCILGTCPCFVPLIPDAADYWRHSAAGWHEIFSRACPGAQLEVASHGNCLVAVAAMYGLAAEELGLDELDHNDPRYPVLITVCCRKPST
jgi:SAM-dependent methyltransferase